MLQCSSAVGQPSRAEAIQRCETEARKRAHSWYLHLTTVLEATTPRAASFIRFGAHDPLFLGHGCQLHFTHQGPGSGGYCILKAEPPR